MRKTVTFIEITGWCRCSANFGANLPSPVQKTFLRHWYKFCLFIHQVTSGRRV